MRDDRVLARLDEGAGEPEMDEAGVDAVDLADDVDAVVVEDEVEDASELRVRFPRTIEE